jgi:thymidylate kinase
MSLPLVIEFVGLPGAGKTAVAHRVIEQLDSAGYRCFGYSTLHTPEAIEKESGRIASKLRTAGRFALSCLTYRRLAVDAFFYTLEVNPRSLSSLRRFFILLLRFRFVRSVMEEGYDVLVLDQGPIQNIWSIATTGGRSPSDRHLIRVLRDVLDELAPLLVLVDVDPDVAWNRIASRPTMRSRFDRMPPSEAREALVRHADLFLRLVDLADGLENTGSVRIDGSRPISDSLAQLLPLIERAREAHDS